MHNGDAQSLFKLADTFQNLCSDRGLSVQIALMVGGVNAVPAPDTDAARLRGLLYYDHQKFERREETHRCIEAKKTAVREAVGKAADPPLSGISKVLMDHFLEVQSPVSCAPRAAFIMCD